MQDLRDTILHHFIDNSIPRFGSIALGQEVNATEGEVILAIAEINEYKDWIRTGDGGGNNRHGYMLRDTEVPAIKQFLEEGGFTRLSQEAEVQNQSRAERELLELEQIRLQIADLKRAVADSKSTRRLSWLAIGISAAALIFEIYKSYH